jgi:phosphopantothenoylcysteine decarboxylase
VANILLGVTGSVAAIRTPALFQALAASGHAVKVVATNASLYFFHAHDLPGGALVTDADEWPRRGTGALWMRDDPVLHIEMRRWADLFLIAPLDANTLAKLANGLCDNCLTCVWRAWDPMRPVVLAPAMNTLMWDHPLTRRHFAQLCEIVNQPPPPDPHDLHHVLDWLNARAATVLTVVAPQSKRLACGDVGVGAMAEVEDLVASVGRLLALNPREATP